MRYTKPETDEQRRFFAKNSQKLKALGLWSLLGQAFWLITSLGVATKLLQEFSSNIPFISSFLPILALLFLFGTHVLLRASVDTQWYFALDDKESTVPSWWLPVVMTVFLVALDCAGAAMLFQSYIEPPKHDGEAFATAYYQRQLDSLARIRADEIASVRTDYNRIADASAAPYLREAERLQSIKPRDWNEKNYIKTKSAENKRNAEQKRSAKLEGLTVAVDKVKAKFEVEEQKVVALRDSALLSYRQNVAQGEQNYKNLNTASWYFGAALSVFLALMFHVIRRQVVGINIHSGRIPYPLTFEGDDKGNALENLVLAVTKSLEFWAHRLAFGLHNFVVGDKELGDFADKTRALSEPLSQSGKGEGENGKTLLAKEFHEVIFDKGAAAKNLREHFRNWQRSGATDTRRQRTNEALSALLQRGYDVTVKGGKISVSSTPIHEPNTLQGRVEDNGGKPKISIWSGNGESF